jgi:hypothetical protein
MRAMIVQPMAGKTAQEIMDTRNRAKALLEDIGYVVENTLFDIDEEWAVSKGFFHIPVLYLSESLKVMSRCHAVYFCKGWQNARGCIVEEEIATLYCLHKFYEP